MAGYKHPIFANLAQVREREHPDSDDAAIARMMRHVVNELARRQGRARSGPRTVALSRSTVLY